MRRLIAVSALALLLSAGAVQAQTEGAVSTQAVDAAVQRIGRSGAPVVKNMTVYFDNGVVSKWEGEYFPEEDSELAKNTLRYFGPNLAKDKKKGGR